MKGTLREFDRVRTLSGIPSDRRAVVLLSGGLDSATVLAVARREGYECHALSIDYGQRHRPELEAAARIARAGGATDHRVLAIDLRAIGGSALTANVDVPPARAGGGAGEIPVTYVPARNTVFLALAAGYGETIGTGHLYIGVNAVDYSGYPDCRPEFIAAMEHVLALGTKRGVRGAGFVIHTPLIGLKKAEIIRLGVSLGVDYSLSVSCYDPDADGAGCGRCESCQFRRQGFREAGVADPTRYRVDPTSA